MTTNGFVFYRGPSMIDGSPIVAVATKVAASSRNTKTGALVQTFILRADQTPVEAIHSGADRSICGDCPHRGDVVDGRNVGRSCYVTVFQAPLVVWKSWQRGIYPELVPTDAAELLAGKTVRLGSYGDPAAVPFDVWAELLAQTGARTGYTHQWRTCDQRFARYTMASCDNAQDYVDAKASGWRTFRVRATSEALQEREIVCPASAEAGNKTTCAACRACGGHSAKARADVAIVVHGVAGKVNAFQQRI